jgi:hypothetical protein
MESFLIFTLVVVLIARWIYLSGRMREMEQQIARLTARIYAQEQKTAQPVAAPAEAPAPPPVRVVPPAAAPVPPPIRIVPPAAAPVPPPVRIVPPAAAPVPERDEPRPPSRSGAEWEALLGGSWLNKAGVLLLVIGMALLLGYGFTHMGPVGIVSISLLGSAAMLVSGVLFEPREPYRIFARGLISGGWAGLYVTVYSMHAVAAARIIESPLAGALLLLLVAAGMIAHSLRYRSEIVTGLSYFIAYFTLAITQSTPLSLAFLVPLAASLLYLAHRLGWRRIALGGLAATYATCALRPDTGAPLWQAQAIFAAYWLLFEIYDIVEADTWLLPLNAVGVLGLSLVKWHRAAPDRVWILLATAAAVYLADALIRSRRGRWQGAMTLTAGLAAAAIFQRLDQQWVATALVVEAELLYLAGLRLRAPYLRWLATGLFAIEGGRLIVDVINLPVNEWAPVAAADTVVFYANRFLNEPDVFFGYGGAAAAALVIGYKAPTGDLGIAWLMAAAVPIAFGWWRNLADLRVQGYALWLLGLIGAAFDLNQLSLASAGIFSYALALCAVRWPEGRTNENFVLRIAAPLAATSAFAALIWRTAGAGWLGIAWIGAAVVLMELALAGWPNEIGGFSMALAALGAVRLLGNDVAQLHNYGALVPRLIPAGAGLAAYWIAYRSNRIHPSIQPAASWLGTAFAAIAVWALAPSDAVAAIGALYAVALLVADQRWENAGLSVQSCALALGAFGWWGWRLVLAPAPLESSALAGCAVTVACLYTAQLIAPRGHMLRLFHSLLATALTGFLLFNEVSGRMLTIAWGMQGVALLAAGFPLRDRVLRLSGLAILLFCILKLFVYDLSYLDTLPRIFSFIVLGVILVAVSWVYTRFRDRVARYL